MGEAFTYQAERDPDRVAIICWRRDHHPKRAGSPGESGRPRVRRARRRPWRSRHHRAAERHRLLRRGRRRLEARRHARSRCPTGCRTSNATRSSSWPSRRSSSASTPLGSPAARRSRPAGSRAADLPDDPLPSAVSPSWVALASGGSTGRPKLIVNARRPRSTRPRRSSGCRSTACSWCPVRCTTTGLSPSPSTGFSPARRSC